MRKLLVVILIAITFSSCEYFLGGGITVEPKVYMVAIRWIMKFSPVPMKRMALRSGE